MAVNEHPAIVYVRNLQKRIQEVEGSLNYVGKVAEEVSSLTGMLAILGECILLGVEVQLLLSQEAKKEA